MFILFSKVLLKSNDDTIKRCCLVWCWCGLGGVFGVVFKIDQPRTDKSALDLDFWPRLLWLTLFNLGGGSLDGSVFSFWRGYFIKVFQSRLSEGGNMGIYTELPFELWIYKRSIVVHGRCFSIRKDTRAMLNTVR